MPCWGAIILPVQEEFETNFPADEDRTKLLDVLMQGADKRVMLLFLDSNRERPAVRQALLARLDKLPVFLQEAVVAMSPVEEIPDDVKEKLHPRARELAESDDAARATERELVEARIKRILAFEYFVPDSGDPREEPDQEPSTSAEEQATR